MAFWNTFLIRKKDAELNNYKQQLFDTVSQNTDVADMSVIKKYFNKVYDNGSDWNAFGVDTRLDDIYAAEVTNKIRKLQDYRSMSLFPQIASALDTICYSAVVKDENNDIIKLQIKDQKLEASDVEAIRKAAQEYFDLFDFDNNFIEYFRKFIIEGQLCWQNVVAKDDLQQGIIDVNFIPNDAYEFCYDIKNRRKYGIMITNLAADMYNIVTSNGLTNMSPGGPISVGGNLSRLNCYQELQDHQCLVLPFEQLTYVDSGIYSADNKYVFSPLQRARRAYNQLMLIEDAILIYRMVRAPEKYVFNVDIGQMGAAKGQQKVAQLMKQFSTKKTYDPATGTVGKAYDPMQMTENFWFVKGADSQGISVNTLTSQHNFGNLDDLEYFLKKLLRSLNIPIARYFEANTEIKVGGEGTPSAEELNFAQFIMSLQQRFSLGILDGLITHLKLKGVWDLYKLNKSKLDVVITPPIEYQLYRKQKTLTAKIEMLKSVLGDEGIAKLFSEEYALTYFMGWDKDKIQNNLDQKFKESIKHAQQEAIIQKMKDTGTIDMAMKDLGWKETLKDILQKDLQVKEKQSKESEEEGGEEESSEGEEGGDEFEEGGEQSGGEEGGEEGGFEL